MNGATEGPVVKICGLRGTEQAVAAARAGADLLGFNFAPVSKRRIELEVAREAIAACREGAGPAPTMVGVFVNQPLEEIAAVVRACRLDAVQLSGSESVAFCRQVGMESGAAVYRAVRLRDGFSLDVLMQETGEGAVSVLLVDAPVAGAWGARGRAGTGPWRRPWPGSSRSSWPGACTRTMWKGPWRRSGPGAWTSPVA